MTRQREKPLALILAAVLMLGLCACSPPEAMSREEIVALVTENEELLQRAAYDIKLLMERYTVMWIEKDASGVIAVVRENGVNTDKSVSSDAVAEALSIEGVQKIENIGGDIRFTCGGGGYGRENLFTGFYYTEYEEPREEFSAQYTRSGEGWEYTRPGDRARYYIEHITGYFYYYEDTY